jgi:hypothetical protein
VYILPANVHILCIYCLTMYIYCVYIAWQCTYIVYILPGNVHILCIYCPTMYIYCVYIANICTLSGNIYTIYVHCQAIYKLFVRDLETGRKTIFWSVTVHYSQWRQLDCSNRTSAWKLKSNDIRMRIHVMLIVSTLQSATSLRHLNYQYRAYILLLLSNI